MMKKLGKFSINTERVMKDEELVNLKGGYYTGCCYCHNVSIMVGSTKDQCSIDCNNAFQTGGTWIC